VIELVENRHVRPEGCRGFFAADDYSRVRAYFAARPRMPATPLVRLPALAARLGLRGLMIKDESQRLGLNAFKGVGACYAIDRLLQSAPSTSSLRGLVCASAGNHGRAVAHAGARCGLPVRVFMSDATADAPRRAIEGEGAQVVLVAGTYDDAVRAAAEDAGRSGAVLVSDTAWPGSESIPRDIMAGYTRILDEARGQWDAPPDLTLVQAGVGSLAAAAAAWWSDSFGTTRPRFVCCEPRSAAPLLESARVGRLVHSSGPMRTVMAGLRCSEPSSLAVPVLLDAAHVFVGIEDEHTFDAMRLLAHPGGDDPAIVAGPSGAAGLGALLALGAVEPTGGASVLLINTEGATDRALYDRILESR
jgi:diaminopropionate ammonia-lyase